MATKKPKPKPVARYTPPKPVKAKSRLGNYVTTGSGAIGVNTAAAMGRIAAGGQSASAPTAPPFDPALAARQAANQARRTTLLSDLDVDAQQTAQETGFQFNPATGQFGGFDPTNPFSQAALLAQTRERSSRATQQSYAQAGQLNSGAALSGQASVQSDYDRGYDTLKRGFDDYVKRYLRRKRDIQTVDPNELVSLA